MNTSRKIQLTNLLQKWSSDVEEAKLFYFRRRQRNRFHEALLRAFMRVREGGHFSKGDLARRSHKDAAQITRILSSPTNLTLDTISDVLLAMDCELEPVIVSFEERRAKKPNEWPPLKSDPTNDERPPMRKKELDWAATA